METVAENQKQSKHTPGPWEYFEQRHWRGEKMYGCVRGGGMVIVNGCAPGGTEEDNANARLIAAAPELLAALELALTTLSSVACNESDEIDNVKTEIANAINKAKGE